MTRKAIGTKGRLAREALVSELTRWPGIIWRDGERTHSNHPSLVLHHGERQARVSYSGTGKQRGCALNNQIRDLRRALRDIGAEPEARRN